MFNQKFKVGDRVKVSKERLEYLSDPNTFPVRDYTGLIGTIVRLPKNDYIKVIFKKSFGEENWNEDSLELVLENKVFKIV